MNRTVLAVLGVALLAAGCADPIVPAAPTPVLPTIAESFSDTLLVRGTNTHTFTVQQIGGVRGSINTHHPTLAPLLPVGAPSTPRVTAIRDSSDRPHRPTATGGPA